MFAQIKKNIGVRTHPVTILLVAGALVTFSSQRLGAVLLYERAAILSGELWRLLTGHLVHFSTEHLLLDLLCIAVVGWTIETRRYPKFGLLCVVSALAVGLVSILFLPGMDRYGGLSAIGISAITYLCLFSLKENATHRWVYWAILFLTAVKIFCEAATGRMLLVPMDDPVVPVPLAHFTGALAAALFFIKNINAKKSRRFVEKAAEEASAEPRNPAAGLEMRLKCD